ncbi:unnamed protein product [Blepharisma stoltei]|uniref:C2 NT-type domain-containing protein n=1 Tax=Blepharisma stoltei TaxID=1481888 RepID=A0AAU9J684_9CILI|nr:unnamed protein product [Blepharisma stoltei]
MSFLHKISSIGSKIGADEVKYDLNVTIHHITAKLNTGGIFKVVVKRGADKKEETQPMHYDAAQSKVIFEYPVSFLVTMYRKGNKFGKKDLSFRMVDLSANKKGEKNGKAIIEVQDLAIANSSIIRKEFPLKGCTDKKAVICVSISAAETINDRNQSVYSNEKPGNRYRGRIQTSTRIFNPDSPIRNYNRNATFVANSEYLDQKNRLSSSFAGIERHDEEEIDTEKRTEVNESLFRTNSVNTQESEEIVRNLSDQYYEPEDQRSPQKKFTYKAEPIFDFDEFISSPQAEQPIIPNDSSPAEASANEILNPEELTIKTENEENILLDEKNKPEEELIIEVDEKEEEDKENEAKIEIPIISPRSLIYRNLEILKENIINPKESCIESEASSSEEELIEIDQEELIKAQLPPSRLDQAVANAKSKEKQLSEKEKSNGLVETRRAACAKCTVF